MSISQGSAAWRDLLSLSKKVLFFGMVDMTHAYNYAYEMISEQLHTHVYPEKLGDMGSNNVASLIMKTLSRLDLLREVKPRGKITIF